MRYRKSYLSVKKKWTKLLLFKLRRAIEIRVELVGCWLNGIPYRWLYCAKSHMDYSMGKSYQLVIYIFELFSRNQKTLPWISFWFYNASIVANLDLFMKQLWCDSYTKISYTKVTLKFSLKYFRKFSKLIYEKTGGV